MRVGGAIVHPAQVEAVLAGLPGVGDCAALGLPGAGGEEIVACVSALPGATPDPAALRDALAARLAPEAVPRRLVVLDALPRQASGKMLKARLRPLFAVPSSSDR